MRLLFSCEHLRRYFFEGKTIFRSGWNFTLVIVCVRVLLIANIFLFLYVILILNFVNLARQMGQVLIILKNTMIYVDTRALANRLGKLLPLPQKNNPSKSSPSFAQ